MKKIIIIFAALFVAVTFTGCVTANPNAQHNPNAPAFIVSPTLTNTAAKIETGLNVAAPIVSTFAPQFAPFVPMSEKAVEGIFGAIAAISLAWAKRKSDNEAQQRAAAAALAATLPPDLHPQALKNAGSNSSVGAVAEHLDASQSPV